MKRWVLPLLGLCLLVGCRGRGYTPLIPTPVLFTGLEVNLFDYVAEYYQKPTVEVFYATNRKRRLLSDDEVRYGNRMDDRVHVGRGEVKIGDEDMTWEDLRIASVTSEREEKIPVTLETVEDYGVLEGSLKSELREEEQFGDDRWAQAINEALARSEQKVIKIYVHGFKVDFDHGAVLGAQFRHFAVREGVTIAFDWACRQSGFLYFGDVKRAQKSVPDLVALLDFLSDKTIAESISIISWSAGAPLHSAALKTIRERHPDWTHDQLYEKYRIDEMIFAASDIDHRSFIEQYKEFYDLPRAVIVTICEDDKALVVARWLHGQSRLGAPDPAEIMADEIAELQAHYSEKAEIVDVTRSSSLGDTEGDPHLHRYWYENSWISTDILMSIYLGLSAEERGLTKDSEYERAWYFDDNYPKKVVEALKDDVRRRYSEEMLQNLKQR